MQNLVIPNFKVGPMHGLFIFRNAAHAFQIFFFGAIKGTRAVIGLTQYVQYFPVRPEYVVFSPQIGHLQIPIRHELKTGLLSFHLFR